MSIRYKVKRILKNLRSIFLTREQRFEESRRFSEALHKEMLEQDRLDAESEIIPSTGPVIDDRDICEGFVKLYPSDSSEKYEN